MKSVVIEATFHELATPRMYQQGRGVGSTLQAAMSAAVRDLLHQPKLKAQRFTMFKATVSIGNIAPPLEESPTLPTCVQEAQ